MNSCIDSMMREHSLIVEVLALLQALAEPLAAGVAVPRADLAEPCYWMNAALGPGAEEWLRGRAGLRCRILTDGTLWAECD